MQTENNQLAVIENSIEVLKTGPEILQVNQIRKDKAIQVGTNILSAIEEEGMSNELDERCMNYLANVNSANKDMKEKRAGVTQIMDQLKKMYTEVENELDSKKPGTIPAKIQSYRNEYAKEVAAEKERKRKEAELIAAKAKEAIDLKSECEKRLFNKYNDFLLARKTAIQNAFNSITLNDFEEKEINLKNYTPVLNPVVISDFELGLFGSYHSREEINSFVSDITAQKLPEFTNNYAAELLQLKSDLVDKLSSKKNELLEQKRIADEAEAAAEAAFKAEEERKGAIANANAKEKARLEAEGLKAREAEEKRQAELKAQQDAAEAEKKRREQEDAARLENEAAEAKKKAEQEAEIKRQGDETMVMFEKEAATAELENGPEARQGYEITVLHPVGFTQIFALWFENEGKNLPIDKIGNTKLDQMKAWAEKHAFKAGTKIESKFIKYEDSFKAVNRKAK